MVAYHLLIGGDDRRRQPPLSSDSGSEHLAEECLSEMVVDFLEEYSGGCRGSWPVDDIADGVVRDVEAAVEANFTEAVRKIRRMVSVNGRNVEAYRELLVGNVQEAAELVAASSSEGGVSQQMLMMILREFHHNAAICKTKWGGSRGVAAGGYEFVDVINGNIRYLVDMNFPAQFEIARPTIQYKELLKSLPSIFIGTVEELKKMVRIMCDAAKISLHHTNLSVPPWRKTIYMNNKWLGPYRRTINQICDKSLTSENPSSWPVKCRWIGFDTAVVVESNIIDASICVRSIKASS